MDITCHDPWRHGICAQKLLLLDGHGLCWTYVSNWQLQHIGCGSESTLDMHTCPWNLSMILSSMASTSVFLGGEDCAAGRCNYASTTAVRPLRRCLRR